MNHRISAFIGEKSFFHSNTMRGNTQARDLLLLSTSNLTTIKPQISVQIPSKPNSPCRILGIEKAQKMAYFQAFLALLSCGLSL